MREKTNYQLGVDIGTSSAAFYAFSLNGSGRPEKYLFHDLMLFGEPVVGEKSVLKSVARREARCARRRTQRRSSRLKKIGHLAKMLGVTQHMQEAALSNVVADKTGLFGLSNLERLWEVRARAAREKISLPLLFSVMLQMAKTRGVSFDVPKSDDKLFVKLKAGGFLSPKEMEKSKAQMCIAACWKELDPDLTVAEILVKKRLNGELSSLGNREKKVKTLGGGGLLVKSKFYNKENFLFHRDDYKFELSLILSEQSKHHPELNEALIDLYPEQQRVQILSGIRNYFWGDVKLTVAQALSQIIFYQYPLKGFEHLIGLCSLDPGEGDSVNRRLVGCHPTANKFLTLKTAFDLRWKNQNQSMVLSPEQIALYLKMCTQPELFDLKPNAAGKVDVDDFYEILDNHGQSKPDGWVLSLDTTRCRKLPVYMLGAAMKKLEVGELFEKLDESQRSIFIQYWSDVIGTNDGWRASGLRERLAKDYPDNFQEILALFDAINESKESIPSLKSLGVADHRIQYGKVACEKLHAFMWRNKTPEHIARDALYPKQFRENVIDFGLLSRKQIQSIIPMVVSPNEAVSASECVEIANPTVRRAIQEVRKRLVERVYQYGPPAKVIIEMAREVKTNQKQRDAESKRQAKMDNLTLAARHKLQDLNLEVNQKNIRRLILLWEQGGFCPYSGDKIREEDAINGMVCHEEHIIPKNAIHRANSRRFIVLSKRSVNLEKGNHSTVHQYFKSIGDEAGFSEMKTRLTNRLKNFSASTPEMDICKKAFESKIKLILRLTPYGEDMDDDEFCDRQLVETSYVGRVIVKLFSSVCTDVFGSRGAVTGLVRGSKILDLNSVLEKVCSEEGKLSLSPKISKKEKNTIKSLQKQINKFIEEGDDQDTPRMKAAQEKLNYLETPLGTFYKRDKEGNLFFNKRADHRHHIVDACAIALSDRSISKQLIERDRQLEKIGHRAKGATSYSEIMKKLPSRVRDDLLEIIRSHVPVPKPDRLYNGALFKENPERKRNVEDESKTDYGATVVHVDAKGKSHHHYYSNDGYCCALISADKDKSRIITLREYLGSPYLKALAKCPTKSEMLLFKGDMIVSRLQKNRRFYSIKMILKSGGEGLCYLESSITTDYENFLRSFSNNDFCGTVSLSSFLKKFMVVRSPVIRRTNPSRHKNNFLDPVFSQETPASTISNSQQIGFDFGS